MAQVRAVGHKKSGKGFFQVPGITEKCCRTTTILRKQQDLEARKT
jgi:hypothetical protein